MNNILEMLIRRSRQATPPTPSDPSLVWYTPFDTDYEDKISGITGRPTENGICEIVSDSRFGGYLDMHKYFGGNLTGLQFAGTQNALQLGTGNWSMSFWMNAPSWDSYGQAIISHRGNGTGFDSKDGFVLFKDSSTYMDMRIGANSNQATSSAIPTDDTWHHWVFVHYSDGEWEWYMDGEYVTGGTGWGENATSNGNVNVFIGGDGDWGKSAVFNLCQLRIYNRYLEYEEIQDLYEEFALPQAVWNGDTADFYSNQYATYQLNQSGDPNQQYEYTTEDSLPNGVTLSSTGLLEFDGSEIYNDESISINVTAGGQDFRPTEASVTINMHVSE